MRILLQKSLPGLRLVRGGHVIDLQIGLELAGFGRGGVDGIFGGQTELAVAAWQRSRSAEATGRVDEASWRGITRQDPPSAFRRCLALTAAFEGHGYTRAAGNWDGAYVTWGIIGFTLKHGNLGEVLRRADARHPGLLQRTIGAGKRDELMAVLDADAAVQEEWADGISLPPNRYGLRHDWADAFEALGHRSEVRAIQDEVAREVYWKRAVQDFRLFELSDECDLALCFDTAVQNGGINQQKADLIAERMADDPDVTGTARRELFAEAIADGSNPRFHDDVLSRRMTLATGEGEVHGARYRVAFWGIEPFEVEDAELA